MNTPITTSSKALADEGRLAAEELVNAKNAIIAELACVSRLERCTQMLLEMFVASLEDEDNPENYLCVTEARAALAALTARRKVRSA